MQDMVDLGALVARYRDEHVTELPTVIAECRRTSSLATVIEFACLMRPGAQKHRHQYRLTTRCIRAVGNNLLGRQADLRRCRSFEEILTTVEGARTKGFGALAVYDAALRIGAALGHLPTEVYLHAGTRKGCKALLGGDAVRRRKTLPKNAFPPEVSALEAHEIEDFMCIFKREFRGGAKRGTKAAAGCYDDARRLASRRSPRPC